MMTEQSSRLSLPLLHASQAQKEMTHNEALTLIDMLLHGCVAGVAEDTPPPNAIVGTCWIVGATPTGAWAGKARHLAGMTAGGWRFAGPRDGMRLWWSASETTVEFRGGSWRVGDLRGTRVTIDGVPVVGSQRAAIAGAEGGSVRDEEARKTLSAVLAALRGHGLIAT